MTEEEFGAVINHGAIPLDDSYSFDLHHAKYLKALKALSDEELVEFATVYSLLVNKAETCDVSQAVFLISNGCGDDDFAAFISKSVVLYSQRVSISSSSDQMTAASAAFEFP